MHNKELIIFGNKGLAAEIFEVAETHYSDQFDDIRIIFFEDRFIEKNDLADKINTPGYTLNFILGTIDYSVRTECLAGINKMKGFVPFTIIHPSAYIARSAKIGNGCFIAPNSSVSPGVTIRDHCLVNLNVTIGHGCHFDEHVVLLPGAAVGGDVRIGEGTLVGSNAFIFQGCKIGKMNQVDALTYIRKDLPDYMLSSSRKTRTIKRRF